MAAPLYPLMTLEMIGEGIKKMALNGEQNSHGYVPGQHETGELSDRSLRSE
jgi:hypothetical protein